MSLTFTVRYGPWAIKQVVVMNRVDKKSSIALINPSLELGVLLDLRTFLFDDKEFTGFYIS